MDTWEAKSEKLLIFTHNCTESDFNKLLENKLKFLDFNIREEKYF